MRRDYTGPNLMNQVHVSVAPLTLLAPDVPSLREGQTDAHSTQEKSGHYSRPGMRLMTYRQFAFSVSVKMKQFSGCKKWRILNEPDVVCIYDTLLMSENTAAVMAPYLSI